MIDMQQLMTAMSLGLLFILFITGAYKRSYTTIIYVVSLSVSMQLYHTYGRDISFLIITIGAIISLIRAVVNHNKDSIFKRRTNA